MDNRMINTTDDLLKRSALVWKELMNYKYIFTYGYKNKLSRISIIFPPEKYPHLAGFQYLNDINIPRYNSKKTVDKILDDSICQNLIQKSQNYEEFVKPRLNALIHLKNTLEEDFLLYAYMPRFYSFATRIKADYLISKSFSPKDYIFIIKSDSLFEQSDYNFVCCSTFEQTNRNYAENQRQRTVLKKERINISTGDLTVLYNRLNNDNI